jgi:esterase/lipase superfamily enzyme
MNPEIIVDNKGEPKRFSTQDAAAAALWIGDDVRSRDAKSVLVYIHGRDFKPPLGNR